MRREEKMVKEIMRGNSFAISSNFYNSVQNVAFKFLADEIKKNNTIKVLVRMKDKI